MKKLKTMLEVNAYEGRLGNVAREAYRDFVAQALYHSGLEFEELCIMHIAETTSDVDEILLLRDTFEYFEETLAGNCTVGARIVSDDGFGWIYVIPTDSTLLTEIN